MAVWVPSATDGLVTETIESQQSVEDSISDLLLTTKAQPPLLDREAHVSFLVRLLSHPLPSYFTGLDASRPWLMYWIVHSLAVLDVQLDHAASKRLISTLRACQNNDTGGYGGGPGQLSHLAPTYAAVLALATIGTDEAYDSIDRERMYAFLCDMKQPDGSFTMHKGGEIDCRSIYCALVVATLLNMATPTLLENTSSYLASCQTYEGGLACASTPMNSTSSAPMGEAHAGYAFCALAAYRIVESAQTSQDSQERQLDVEALTRWSTSLQGIEIESFGFRGRTNKLVDGCYAGWSGGIVQLLETNTSTTPRSTLFDRSGLQQYVLKAAQAPGGGLRDKPGKHPDAYHTAYNLTGLSFAQHDPRPFETRHIQLARAFDQVDSSRIVEVSRLPIVDSQKGEREDQARQRTKKTYASVLAYQAANKALVLGDPKTNKVMPVHPLFNIIDDKAKAIMDYFYLQ